MDIQALRDSFEDLKEKLEEIHDLISIEQKRGQVAVLEKEASDPQFWQDQENATRISKQLSDLQSEVAFFDTLKKHIQECMDMSALEGVAKDTDMKEELEEQYEQLRKKIENLEFLSLFDGKYDEKNALVTIQAGAGGTEAQDWAQMLMRMVFRFSEKNDWKTTILDQSDGNEAGIKSITFRVDGRYAYGYLKSEHGTHRLVRISPFDAESMRHTSFASIEVIPEIDSDTTVTIDPKDLRIDTFMSSGKGGQSVNTTYSAVRIVHIPTGIMVQCQNERSQLQNKETAMKVLQSKLQLIQDEKEEQEREQLRGEHKKAEWGNQIRSYVLHPYKMVKDVRTKHESSDPDAVLDGDIGPFIEAYLRSLKMTVS